MDRKPSILKIITVDYAAFLATLSPLVLWGMYGVLLVIKNISPTDLTYPAIAAGVTLISAPVLLWRIRMFSRIFNDGYEAPATISKIFFYRDRGRINYTYTYQGQKFAAGNAVHKVKQTKKLKVGDQVVVIVDPVNPKRAYLRDLYLEDGLE